MIQAESTPNIALIKYWGNRENTLRLPAADSLSITLNSPSVTIGVEHSPYLNIESVDQQGTRKEMTHTDQVRFQQFIDLTKSYLSTLGAESALRESLSLSIESRIPPKVGLASSAGVFSCAAKAISGLIKDHIELTDEQISVIARLGSGSAARSIYGGFCALHAGDEASIDAVVAIQIADESHWMLHDIVLIPSHDEKKVGSTEGHALASTSPFFQERIETIMKNRQQECVDAIVKKDFQKLTKVTEEDCMNMHHVMQTSSPSLQYLSSETLRIVSEVEMLRTRHHIPVLYTMDAGPTVHLICTDEGLNATLEYANQQTSCTLIQSRIGRGAQLLS